MNNRNNQKDNGDCYPKYTVSAAVGHMDATVEAENARVAYELWEDAIDKLVEEVKEMDAEERNKIGLQ